MAAKPPNKYGTGECHGECGWAAMGDLAVTLKGSLAAIEGSEMGKKEERGCGGKGVGLLG
jgi:hypothetical protein